MKSYTVVRKEGTWLTINAERLEVRFDADVLILRGAGDSILGILNVKEIVAIVESKNME